MSLTVRDLWRLLAALALLGALVALPTVTLLVVLASRLEPEQRRLVWQALDAYALPLAGLGLASVAAAGWLLWRFYRRYPLAARELAQRAALALEAGAPFKPPPKLASQLQPLAALIERALQRIADVDARIATKSAELVAERGRLAALMADLPQGIIVCTPAGQVLLYNARAQALFASEALGLGRSLFALLDRSLIAHAIARLQTSQSPRAVHLSAAAPDGRWLWLQLAPVWDEAKKLQGFVLILDDVTETAAVEVQREERLAALIEQSRARLASIRAAAEALAHFDVNAVERERFVHAIYQEAEAYSGELEAASRVLLARPKARWAFERIPASDLLEALADYVESRLGTSPGLERSDRALWLSVDAYALTRAIGYLIDRLEGELGVQGFWLRLSRRDNYAELELWWPGPPLPSSRLSAWETAVIALDGISVRSVIERHGGALWAQRTRAALTLLLPLAEAPAAAPKAQPSIAVRESRPVFYDFDLLERPLNAELAQAPLARLSYAVFDLETTGLAPSTGDEIVAIGAVRIVNGRLLPNEAFEQLVDPQRPLAPTAVAVHGLSEAVLRGQPTIDAVLPRFARFVGDSVLVAHNAAFDLRFLQLKEHLGVRFDNPVLDTLLLATLVWPGCPSYDLEALAQRCGVTIIGRHTALGDAMVTAEVFLKLLPLLRRQGIRTLGEAQAAAQQSRLAHLSY